MFRCPGGPCPPLPRPWGRGIHPPGYFRQEEDRKRVRPGDGAKGGAWGMRAACVPPRIMTSTLSPRAAVFTKARARGVPTFHAWVPEVTRPLPFPSRKIGAPPVASAVSAATGDAAFPGGIPHDRGGVAVEEGLVEPHETVEPALLWALFRRIVAGPGAVARLGAERHEAAAAAFGFVHDAADAAEIHERMQAVGRGASPSRPGA